MNHNIVETFLGMVVLLTALVFAIFVGNYLFDSDIEDSYIFEASFDDASGIKSGTSVIVSGIKVGKVVSINLNKDSTNAIAKIKISGKIKIPEDSSLEIASTGLTGGSFLKINLGSSDKLIDKEIKNVKKNKSLEQMFGEMIFIINNK